MALTISQVTHYPDTNTLEVSWTKQVADPDTGVTEIIRKKCISYSSEQKTKFLNACDPDGQKYVTMAGW